jgi:hypothetical protein
MACKVNKEAVSQRLSSNQKLALRRITDKLAGVIGVVCQRMAELVPNWKANCAQCVSSAIDLLQLAYSGYA